jgi:hypothetical protein
LTTQSPTIAWGVSLTKKASSHRHLAGLLLRRPLVAADAALADDGLLLGQPVGVRAALLLGGGELLRDLLVGEQRAGARSIA